jgi:serine/threonine protein kinase HipA of HipAB toxin-antitoxin module
MLLCHYRFPTDQYGDRRVLIVERFDRLWTQDGRLLRLPQEDCCQALSVVPSRKYQSDGGPGVEAILQLLRGSDTPTEDQRDFLKAVITFWLLGATNGHAKNFSVFVLLGGRYHMTPLYDVISAQPSVDTVRFDSTSFAWLWRWATYAAFDSAKYAVSAVVGFIMGKSAIHLARTYGEHK